MRDFQLPGRSPVSALNGMAATSHPAATLAALDMLRAGGNAVDAAVAACAVLCVVEPMSTGVGGDCFVLYAPGGGGEVIAYNGSGRSPAAAETAWYVDQGMTRIDELSPHAVTVPGAIDAWSRLVADHGRKGLDEVLAPAIGYAEDGYAVLPRVASAWAGCVDKLLRDEDATRILLDGGQSPGVGATHRQPALAETLRTIARDGRAGFYTGRVAEDIVAKLNALGGLHTLDDFAAAGGDYVTPIKTDYRGHDIYQCPPNGQGIVALIMLNILAGYDLAELDPLGVDRLHLEVEAGRLAFCDRDALIADPDQSEVPGRGAAVGSARGRGARAHPARRRAQQPAADRLPRARRHGLSHGGRRGPQRDQLHQLAVRGLRQRYHGAPERRRAAEPGRRLRRSAGPSELHRAVETPDAYDHPRHGAQGRPASTCRSASWAATTSRSATATS